MDDFLRKLHLKHLKLERLAIPTLEGFEMINVADILYLEADNSYTSFHFKNGDSLVSSKGIGYYEEEFEDEPFLRVHQSYIVNLNQVRKYIRADNGYIILSNNKAIRVSKSRKEELLSFFKIRRIQNTSLKGTTTNNTTPIQK